MAAVLSESVLDQYGPRWSKRPFWSKGPYCEPDFSIRETKVNQDGPFWYKEAHFGPIRSANCTLAIPERGFSGVRKRVVSKRVVLADVPPERKPERGYVRQNHPFRNRPFISQ